MARFFKDKIHFGDSRREKEPNGPPPPPPTVTAATANSLRSPAPAPALTAKLPSPFGELGCDLSDAELRETAYEIFVGACRSAGGRPLTYIPQSERASAPERTSSLPSSSSYQKSLTSATASKVKKALGLKSSSASRKLAVSGMESGGEGKVLPKGPRSVGELVRVQMGISEQADSRIRRVLLRVAAGQLGRRIESMVLPLELLQQCKASDFKDPQEYEVWQARQLKILEAGLLLHPHLSLDKSDASSQRLKQIIHAASERPLETGRNSESMQLLNNAVTSLACRSFDGLTPETYHWADGPPFNLHLYQMLLEALFDTNEEGSIIDEVDEVLELIKKTWAILGINQMLHNLCFTWMLFRQFITTGKRDTNLVIAADNLLVEVSKDAKATKDPVYTKLLSSTVNSILAWTEKRLLAYHETFHSDSMDSMEYIVSLAVSAARIVVEDIPREHGRKKREEVDIACSKIDTYIRSSLRAAFARKMEQADLTRRYPRSDTTHTPILRILAKDIESLAIKEKEVFSPILHKWHPLAAGVAVATLHSCYGNELKQFIASVSDLTPDSAEVLKAAEKLEKELVQIAVEDSVDSEDGGKALIREMLPYEAESKTVDLVITWIKTRVDRLKECVDRSLQQENWSTGANKENIAYSAVEILRIIDETLEAFFKLPIPMHPALLPDLIVGLDQSVQHYVFMAKAGCGTRSTFFPPLPLLTRCSTGSKFQGVLKKKEKSLNVQKRKSQVGTLTGDDTFNLTQLCVRVNTVHHIRTELESLEKRIITCVRNAESSQPNNINGIDVKFELSLAACHEGVQQLCEATAYRTVFIDLSPVFWESLYVGDVASSTMEPLLKELDPTLETISSNLHNRLRNRVITAVMKASFDAFLLVLLAGGPSRAFTLQDFETIEYDFRYLKEIYLADGDGIPEEVVEKASIQVRNVLPLFSTDTQSLIERFKQMIVEDYGPVAKSKLPLPPTTGNWNPADPNTLLRILCYRNDAAASKFLKKAYDLPKKL